MLRVGNTKLISIAHIAAVEYEPGRTYDARDPRDEKLKPWFGFNLTMSTGGIEQCLFETTEEAQQVFESLIEAMEKAGY